MQTNPVMVSISPTSAQLFLGTTQQFTAAVTNATNPGVTWRVNGITGGSPSIGTITTAGLYTAPQSLPSPATVTVSAVSVQDATKSASAEVTVASDVGISVSPISASVELGATRTFTATITGTGSPSAAVSWSVNDIPGGNLTVGTVSPTGVYTAPAILPSPVQVTLRATSLADTSRSATAMITVTATFTFSVTGPASVVNGAQAQYVNTVAPLTGSNPNTAATWSVGPRPGEDCGAGGCGAIDFNTGLYRAPNQPPSPSPMVRVTGRSVADSTKTAFVDVTITSAVVVFVSPQQVTLPAGGTQPFSATVGGTTNQDVTWSVSGASCSDMTCGEISPSGVYNAPALPPQPDDRVTITATSMFDPAASDDAIARITTGPTGPFIQTLAPASVTAGAASSFTFRVSGVNFDSTGVIVFNGSTRSSSCTSNACTMTLTAADVSAAGNKTVQVQTSNGAVFSNQVNFVVLAQPGPPGVIALTSANPEAAGRDIIVVDPTTAGTGAEQINIESLGVFDSASTSCNPRGSPIAIQRAAAGTNRQVELCVFGTGLSALHSYSFSGPSPSDIVISPPQSLGTNLVKLVLTLSDSTQLGPRTLFVENANKEKAAATGAIEVKAP